MSSPVNPPEITQERVRNAISNWRGASRAIEFPEDVEKIRSTLLDALGIDLPPSDVVEFWEWYSEFAWCAGWIRPDASSIVRGFPKWISMMEGTLWDEGWGER
jgi:hypothetical protein